MKDKQVEDLERIAEKLGEDVVRNSKKLLKDVIPSWLELQIQHGLKPVRQMEERQDRMEQEQRQQGKDLERLLELYKQQAENTAEIKINTNELPKVVKKENEKSKSEIAGALVKTIEAMPKKPKAHFLRRLWKRGKNGK